MATVPSRIFSRACCTPSPLTSRVMDTFRLFHVVIRRLEEPEKDVLHVVSHVARLRQGGGVRDGKGHLQELRQGLGKQGLAGTGGAQEQDIALLQLHVLVLAPVKDALIVVVDRNGKGDLGPLLSDDILIQKALDLPGGGQAAVLPQQPGLLGTDGEGHIILHDPHAGADAFVADKGVAAREDPGHIVLGFAAEGASGNMLFIHFHSSSLRSDPNRVRSNEKSRGRATGTAAASQKQVISL